MVNWHGGAWFAGAFDRRPHAGPSATRSSAVPALAELLPILRDGPRCPIGYTVRDFRCVPLLGVSCRVVPKDGACPTGFAADGERYCVERDCR